MDFHDVLDDDQPQAAQPFFHMGAEEWFVDPGQQLRGDARPVIADGNGDPPIRGVESGGDGDRAVFPCGQGLGGVLDKVHQGGLNPVTIHMERRQAFRGLNLQDDVRFLNQGFHQRQGFVEEFLHCCSLEVGLRRPGDPPDVLNDRMEALGLLNDELQLAAHVRWPAAPFQEEPRQAGDGVQGRSQIVGQGGGQMTHGGKSLELVDLILQLHDLDRLLLDAIFQMLSQLPVPCQDLLDLRGHVIEMRGQVPQFIRSFQVDAVPVVSFLKFVDRLDDGPQRPADQPVVTDEKDNEDDAQQADAAVKQQHPGPAQNLRPCLGKTYHPYEMDAPVLFRHIGVEQRQGGAAFGIDAQILGLHRLDGGGDGVFRPVVGDPSGPGDEFDGAFLDGQQIDAGQAGIGLDMVLQGRIEGGQTAAGGEVFVIGAYGVGQLSQALGLLFSEEIVEYLQLHPSPDGHGHGYGQDGYEHQAGANGHGRDFNITSRSCK